MKRQNSDNGSASNHAPKKRRVLKSVESIFVKRLESNLQRRVVQRLVSVSDFDRESIPQELIGKRYQIIKFLGQGGFAKVIKAYDLEIKKEVAIKIGTTKIPIMIALLRREIDALKRLEHDNIIKAYDFYIDRKLCCIVMELVDGGELLDRIYRDRSAYTEGRVQRLVRTLLSAIQHMHDRGVVHRDLKPDNLVMVHSNDHENLKIVDFGGSVIMENDLPIQCDNRVGTAYYMSPEIVPFQPHGKPADLWSFGVIIYLLLFGTVPYLAPTKSEIFRKIQYEDYTLPVEPVTITSEARDFVRALLNKNPHERMTVTQALNHPWLLQNRLQIVYLAETKRYLGRYQVKKRLRKFFFVILAAVAFRRALRLRKGLVR